MTSLDARGFWSRPPLSRFAVFSLLLAIAFVMFPTQAHAADERITRYTVAATVDQAGTAQVVVNFDYDYGYESRHGPLVTLIELQRVPNNPDVWRKIEMSNFEASSSTGAPADLDVSREDGSVVLRIGHPDKTVRGQHSYTLSYTARGLIAPRHEVSGLDELNWTAIGIGWQVPIENATATVTGPVAITKVGCFRGAFDTPCTAQHSGSTATYAADATLPPGSGLQIVAGFPAGTFTDAEPVFVRRHHIGNMFPINATSGGLAVLVGLLSLAGVAAGVRKKTGDEVFLGLTPGMRPAPGQAPTIGRASGAQPVAVQFTPPAEARPGELGVLKDGSADDIDVSATIIDLAVRGHLTIEEFGKKKWRFRRHSDGRESFTPAEAHVMATLFAKKEAVTTDDLKDEKYANLLPGARNRLYERVVGPLGWFKGNPETARVVAAVLGLLIVAAGVGLAFLLGVFFGLGLVGVGVVVAGLVLAAQFNKFGRRTAEGSAVLAQMRGFEQYLKTAEADQIKFEEGIDIFSRYLPYAMVFGVAERWAGIFAKLAAEGRYAQQPDWYVGYTPFYYANFGASMDGLGAQLSETMNASVAASSETAGSGGGSGFSGGGGFGGGGGGSW